MVKVFVVNGDDSLSVLERELGAPKRESKMPEILKKLEAAKFSAAEVRPLIAEEIARLIKEMSEYESDATRVKSCTAQINALPALEKLLEKTGSNGDGLNFDGPQFRFAFFKIVGLFKEATRKVIGSNSETWNKIMDEFRAQLKMNDQEIRRQTARFPSGSEGEQRPWTNI